MRFLRLISSVPFLLLVLGLTHCAWRWQVDEIPLQPGRREVTWTIEARVRYQATEPAAKVQLTLPSDPAYLTLTESAAAPGYSLRIREEGGLRRAQWTTQAASGDEELFFWLHLRQLDDVPTDRLLSGVRSDFPPWESSVEPIADQLVERIEQEARGPRARLDAVLRELSASAGNPSIALLRASESSDELLQHLLADLGIESTRVLCLRLKDARRYQSLVPLIAVRQGKQLRFIDPQYLTDSKPSKFLFWAVGQTPVLDLVGGSESAVSFSMIRDERPVLTPGRDLPWGQQQPVISLYQLPIGEQALFRGMLLLPVAVMIVTAMRLLVGLRTSGTFMPALMALALLQTSLAGGLIGFLMIISIGMFVRSVLTTMNLLLVARVSIGVLVVIFLTGLLTIIAYNFGLSEGLTVTFFPVVICAWTIERVALLWEEEGAWEVTSQLGGSLLVASIAYGAISNHLVQHWVFQFLGVHLIILAAILWMGSYTGYRLLELRRFRALFGGT